MNRATRLALVVLVAVAVADRVDVLAATLLHREPTVIVARVRYLPINRPTRPAAVVTTGQLHRSTALAIRPAPHNEQAQIEGR